MQQIKGMKRRDFLKCAGAGLATIVIGCGGGGGDDSASGNPPPPDGGTPPPDGGGTPPPAVTETLNFTITDILKEMITHEPTSPVASTALCYFWVFKEARFAADCPAPQVFAVEGDRIVINVTNALDGPHSFFIPGPGGAAMADTGPIAPGATANVDFIVGAAGTYLYQDNLNDPVNRVMGLHGAFVVMPKTAAAGHKLTPYSSPTPGVQALFDDFGSQPWWPGLSWEQGDAGLLLNPTPPTRQAIWLCHQASPVLFERVGLFAQNNPGKDFDAAQFVDLFLNDPFINTNTDVARAGGAVVGLPATPTHNHKPQFFTINGQSGHFSHNHGFTTPMYRVGEPTLIRVMNAGLMTHSMHIHANHVFVTSINNVPQENPFWVDTFTNYPMGHFDYVIPFMRPPDVPNARGIGRADAGLTTANGTPAWPPVEEFGRFQPAVGAVVATGTNGLPVDMAQRQSPLCYPMHDHSEPTQTAQGGNYNCGLISGMYFIGDRNGLMDFPIDADFQMMLDLGRSTTATGPAAGNAPA